MAKHPQPPPLASAETFQVRDALLELLSDDLIKAVELIADTDDGRGSLRALLGYTRQLVPGRSKRTKPVEQLVPPTPEAARAALRACSNKELRTRLLPPLAQALRKEDPQAPRLLDNKPWKLVLELASRFAGPSWREQLHAAHAQLLVRRAAAAAEAEAHQLALAEARRPWAPDEVRQIAGHLVQRAEDGTYYCTVCGWVWKRKPRTETACPGLPRYVKGTVPEHLKTERQLRQDDRVAPTGPAVAVLHLRYQSGVGFIPLYDIAQVRPLQQRAPARRRCQRCRAFIEREAPDQQHCSSCAVIVAEEQARQEVERLARREEHERRRAEREAQRPVVPLSVEQVLDALRDLWLLNRRARTLDPDTREHAYALKSAVLASIWRSTSAASAPQIRNAGKEPETSAAHFGLEHWEFVEQHALDLGQDTNEQHLGVAFGHIQAQSGYHSWRSYLALTFFRGTTRYPFHVPFDVAQAWFPMAQWALCKRRRWTESRPFTFGGGVLDHQESQAINWKQVIGHLAHVTGEPQRWQRLGVKALYAPPFYHWDEDD
jgi:hypothetical protein